MAKTFTAKDIRKAEQDDRWGGFGYLGERKLLKAADRKRADALLLEAATIGGWSDEEFFQFVNSRPGRHYADHATYGDDATLIKYYLSRANIDALMAEVNR